MAADPPKRLRVATFNLLHGVALPAGHVDLCAAAETLAVLDADIVALQEVDRDLERSGRQDQTAWLAQELGYEGRFAPALVGTPDGHWRRAGSGDREGPAYGVGVLSRIPIAGTARTLLPGGDDVGTPQPRKRRRWPLRPGYDHEPRVALSVLLRPAGVTLRVTATHLSYMPWRAVRQLRAAARAADGGGPAVLLGDLNLPPAPVRAALGRRWLHPGNGPTFPAWQPKAPIDHVLATGGVTLHDVHVADSSSSDHLPLVAEVGLPTGAG